MSKESYITAIDIGSDKIATLIGVVDQQTQQLRVAGYATVPSQGVLKSVIVDLDAVLRSVEQSLNAAERMAGFSVQKAYVSLSGGHIKSQNSTGVVAVANPEKEITSVDVERVIEAARAVSVPPDREIIHVIPRYFKVDSQEGIRDPTHMTGVRLESEAHLITGSSTAIRNIRKCLNDLGIEVEGFVFSALASSEVCLSETEKELGVVLCDLGAGSSSFCVFVDGAIEFSGSIPIGAKHITQDIALGCRIDREIAEKIKLHLSESGLETIKPLAGESKKDFVKRKAESDILDLSTIGISDIKDELSGSFLVKGVMYPRIQEIVTKLGEALDKEHLLDKIPAGVVYTGGGALTLDLIEISERVLGLPARVGKPRSPQGLITETQTASLASVAGLLMYGVKQGGCDEVSHKFKISESLSNLHIEKLGSFLVKLVKKILP